MFDYDAIEQALNWHVQQQSDGNYLLWPDKKSGGKALSSTEYAELLSDARLATAGQVYYYDIMIAGLLGLAAGMTISLTTDANTNVSLAAIIGAIVVGPAMGQQRHVRVLLRPFAERPDIARPRTWWDRMRGNASHQSSALAWCLIMIGLPMIVVPSILSLSADIWWLGLSAGLLVGGMGLVTLVARRQGGPSY